MPRKFSTLGLSLAAIVIAVLAFRYPFVAETTGPEVEMAMRGDIENVVTAVGKIQPRSYVDVGAQASRQLRRILVQVGDEVSAGQPLAEIDPQVQQAKVEADKAELARLEATLAEQHALAAFAEKQFGRNKSLVGQNAVSQSSFDESERDVKTSRRRLTPSGRRSSRCNQR